MSVISVLKPGHQSWFVCEREAENQGVLAERAPCAVCRVQCGLVGTGGADVRDDGGEIPVRHHHWQSRHEHWRLPLPRYSLRLWLACFGGKWVKWAACTAEVGFPFSVLPHSCWSWVLRCCQLHNRQKFFKTVKVLFFLQFCNRICHALLEGPDIKSSSV